MRWKTRKNPMNRKAEHKSYATHYVTRSLLSCHKMLELNLCVVCIQPVNAFLFPRPGSISIQFGSSLLGKSMNDNKKCLISVEWPSIKFVASKTLVWRSRRCLNSPKYRLGSCWNVHSFAHCCALAANSSSHCISCIFCAAGWPGT